MSSDGAQKTAQVSTFGAETETEFGRPLATGDDDNGDDRTAWIRAVKRKLRLIPKKIRKSRPERGRWSHYARHSTQPLILHLQPSATP